MMTHPLQDIVERDRRAQAERAARNERARANNLKTFEAMWLTLGSDVLKLDGTRHDAELAEARGLAAYRWNQLLGMEAQAQREEQELASRPQKRPIQTGDDLLPDRTIAQRDREWEDATKHRAESLAALKDQIKQERAELEAFTKPSK